MSAVVTGLPFGDSGAIVFHSLLGTPRLIELGSQNERDRLLAALGHVPVHIGDAGVDRVLNVSESDARVQLSARNAEYMARHADDVRFLSLVVAENCNLGCSYCIAGANMEASRLRRVTRMGWPTAKVAIDWFAGRRCAGAAVVNFTGGEPLLNWPVIERVIDYVDGQYPRLASDVAFSINTNATLVTPKIASFLALHDVAVATSLDGNPEASDLVRITRGGLGVSARILAGWDMLAQAGIPVDGFMATFNEFNYEQLDQRIVDFAMERGCKWLRVDCDVIHLLNRPVQETIDRLWSVYSAGRDVGVIVEGFWSTPAKNLVSPDYELGLSFFCGAVSGETVSIHPDGRISACGFSRQSLGTVTPTDLEHDLQQHRALVASHLPGAREFCRGCVIEGPCAGGCNIAIEESGASGSEAAIRYNCEIYREMTRRLLPLAFSPT
jgi:radical SAM protein with 4Fe4S-binding SPASM domain